MADLVSGKQTDIQLQPVEVVDLLLFVFSFHVCVCLRKWPRTCWVASLSMA